MPFKMLKEISYIRVNPRTQYANSYLHGGTRGSRGGGGGGLWMELPRFFDMLQYFETILPLVESL